MYLKSLEMLGFKSFAEARIEFPSGVTAIVGPNGSGKSNVVDAILWALGEQSTRTLRSEKMEDVIFNGTELRKPLGMAEVSLVISGLDRIKVDAQSGLSSQLAEYQDLMITRRLYRNGESEYLLNKIPCRLKDIRTVLLDTRAGTKGHTVIAQGQIDQILSASPQDRRELIEETAGIIRYKKQKAEALRKLDATQQNLLRVRDIITEVKKQLNSLERQARQARSYQVLQQEARSLEVQLLADEYRRLREILTSIEQELEELSEEESRLAAEQARYNAEHERIRLAINEASRVIGQRRDELSGIEQQQAQALTAAEVERHRGELFEQQRIQGREELERLTREQEQARNAESALLETIGRLEQELMQREQELTRIDCELKDLVHQRAATLQEEERGRRDVLNLAVLVANTEQSLTQMALRLQELSERDDRLARERAEVQSQHDAALDQKRSLERAAAEAERIVAGFRHQQDQIHANGENLAAALHDAEQQLSNRSEELAAVDSHLRALQGVLREDMGYGRLGDEETTALKACDGVHEAIAEWLVVPADLDRAVEAFLGERVRGWLVDGPQTASAAIAFLTGKGLGRGSFIPQFPRWNAEVAVSAEWWPTLSGQSGVIGRAIELLAVAGPWVAARDYLFNRVVFVETLSDALRLWEEQGRPAPEGPIFVTRTGDLLDAAGLVTGGQVTSSGGLLQRRREVLGLESRRELLVEGVEEARHRREGLLAESQLLREEGRRVAEALREAEMRSLSLQKDALALPQTLDDLAQRIETLMSDVQRGSIEGDRLEQEARSGRAQLAQWIAEKAGQESAVLAVRARLQQTDHGMQNLQQRLTESHLTVQGLRTTREHRLDDLERIRQERQEDTIRIEALRKQVEAFQVSIEQCREERGRQEGFCREFGQSAQRVKAQVIEVQERQAQDMKFAEEVEIKLEDVRKASAALRETRLAIEVRRAESRTQLGTVESTLAGTYQVDPASLVASPEKMDRPVQQGDGGESIPEVPSTLREEELRQQLHKVRERLDRMGPINLAAISEHQELEERYRFLTTQEQDLSASISSLREIIQRINRTTKDMFAETFAELQERFGEVFGKFFPGGRAELQLVEVPVDANGENRGPQEPGVEIVAQPPGKRLKSITMLSGGEKTLTAMALLFASFLIRPTPFCVLDEIDAPLDEENIGRFTQVLCGLAEDAQFMVITHNKRTMGIADSLFGVTMEEPGISTLVSVRLSELQPV